MSDMYMYLLQIRKKFGSCLFSFILFSVLWPKYAESNGINHAFLLINDRKYTDSITIMFFLHFSPFDIYRHRSATSSNRRDRRKRRGAGLRERTKALPSRYKPFDWLILSWGKIQIKTFFHHCLVDSVYCLVDDVY